MFKCAWYQLTTLKCDAIESPSWPTLFLHPTYMTDWDSPTIILSEYFVYANTIHLLFGLYIWEVIMSLDFDYAILTRKRDFRPSFLLYFGARWFPLIVIFLEMLGQDVRYMNCQLYVVFAYLLTYLGFLFASSLIVLRIVAIWERDKIAMTIAGCTWLSNFVMCIYCVATVRAVWIAPLRICGISDVLKVRFSIISIISSEVVLLALVIVGLLRWRNRGKGGLWKLLFTQGLAWVVVTLVAEIPPLVFILLNLNVMMDLITHLPAFISMHGVNSCHTNVPWTVRLPWSHNFLPLHPSNSWPGCCTFE